MFSQSVEYALRAAVFLATRVGQPCTTEEVAKHTKVPGSYLSKILQGLTKAGLVKSSRGARGGVSLKRSPEEVTILEIVNAFDPIKRIRTCPLGLKQHGTRLCPLHSRVDAAMATVETAFHNTTLAEVLSETSGSVPLCNGDVTQPPLVQLNIKI